MIQWVSDHNLRWMWLAFQLLLGVIFCYAGVSKLLDTLRFTSSLLGYQIIPLGLIHPLVVTLPWIEIGLGGLLIFGQYPRFTSGSIAVLLLLFTVMVTYAVSQGWLIDCGCFGSPRPADGQKIFENGVMFLVALRFCMKPGLVRPFSEWKQMLVEWKW